MSSSPPASLPSGPSSGPPSSPPSSVAADDGWEKEMRDVQPSEVEYLDTLSVKRQRLDGHKLIVTLKVKIRGRLCVMKVFRGDYEEVFLDELSAYLLLKEKGFCKRGVVPKFYGTIDRINIELWPELWWFAKHKLPPSAVLIEYIPNAEKIDIHNFSQENIDELSKILLEFHEIGLLHGDPYPRNMMVVRGTPKDRVFWIDFDNSLVRDGEILTRGEEWQFQLEKDGMSGLAKALAMDAKNGKLDKAFVFYC